MKRLLPARMMLRPSCRPANVTVTSSYTVLPAGVPTLLASPTATPTPVPAPAANLNAPAIIHDDRYFLQTGYRIDNEDVWSFFQQYGGINTFGYHTSRLMTFLGCPVQMFQRQIIQVCAGQGAALINMLHPEIFPYTHVNGSTFPAPDAAIKNNAPQVGTATYADDVNTFIKANVPDSSVAPRCIFCRRSTHSEGSPFGGRRFPCPPRSLRIRTSSSSDSNVESCTVSPAPVHRAVCLPIISRPSL